MNNSKIILSTALIVLLILIATIALRVDHYRTPERVEWKNKSVAELSSMDEKKWGSEVDFSEDGWFSKHAMRMQDGSWIAYRQVCSKENKKIHDIFIGKGSDGRWYYSTYHFCIDMYAVQSDQPESLGAFVDRFFLVAFDGESDDCLLPTWPPEEVTVVSDPYSKAVIRERVIEVLPLILLILLVASIICLIRLRRRIMAEQVDAANPIPPPQSGD